MTSTLLRSQFEALEPPKPEENALEISIENPPEAIVDEIRAWLERS